MLIKTFDGELLEQTKQKLLHVLHERYDLLSFKFHMNELSWSVKDDVEYVMHDDQENDMQYYLETFVDGYIAGVSVYHTWF